MVGRVRRYDNRHRSAQAARTGDSVIAAAGEQFLARGYARTTIRDIASTAGVSPETVYKAFGSKLELLRLWIDERVAGPDEPVAVVEQRWVQEIATAADPRRQLAITAAALTAIHARSADAIAVLAAAAHADAAAAALWDTVRGQRLADVRAVVSLIAARGGIDPALPASDVVDIAHVLSEPHLYRTLVRDHGWHPHRYEAWLTDLLWQQLGAKDQPNPTTKGEHR